MPYNTREPTLTSVILMSDTEVYIFEVSNSSFGQSVLLNSHKIPVLVEFMGVWSEPCILMSDTLSRLAAEFAGQFIFAKVDIDEQPELKDEYGIENVPTLKVFKDGEVVHNEEGMLQEDELRAILKGHGIYNASDELRMEARQKHMAGDTVEAMNLLTTAIQQDPRNTRVAMDMVQIFLDIDELEQATALFNRLPDKDKKSETGMSLVGQITFRELAAKTEGKASLQERVGGNPGDHDARFDLAVCLVAEHDYQGAMDQLFAVFEAEPEYKQGAAREMIINLCNMLAPNEPQLAQAFRQRLGNVVSG